MPARFAGPAGRLLLAGVLVLLAVSCRPSSPAGSACPAWPVLYAPLDAFDLERNQSRPVLDTTVSAALTYAQRRALLHDAYGVGCCLTQDARHDSTYVGASFYALAARLAGNPRAPCHVLVIASMDDFSGLYLVLQQTKGRYASLYVAGTEGSGATQEDGLFFTPRISTGRLLNDSLVQVKTTDKHLAFQHSGNHSYADTTTTVFRIDYRTATFHELSTRTQHVPLAEFR